MVCLLIGENLCGYLSNVVKLAEGEARKAWLAWARDYIGSKDPFSVPSRFPFLPTIAMKNLCRFSVAGALTDLDAAGVVGREEFSRHPAPELAFFV